MNGLLLAPRREGCLQNSINDLSAAPIPLCQIKKVPDTSLILFRPCSLPPLSAKRTLQNQPMTHPLRPFHYALLTKRFQAPSSSAQVVHKLNLYVRGWAGYFHYRNSSTVFGRVKWHLEERLRTHLRKRHKLKSQAAGYEPFPNQRLYTPHGLFKLPTTDGWTRTHA